MRVCCISDLHGFLPEIPPCDLLLIGGDVIRCGLEFNLLEQSAWLDNIFSPWLRRQPAKHIVGVAGNHDFIFARAPQFVPALPWTYLLDSGTEVEGLKIWGAPWQPIFRDWAFNLPEAELAKRWAAIPDDTDILVLHGPPAGVGDFVPNENANVGSPSLRTRIEALRPQLVVFGHIHEGYGKYRFDSTILVNAAHCDGRFEPNNAPIVVGVDVQSTAA
jgi:predicted phosphodiesterase